MAHWIAWLYPVVLVGCGSTTLSTADNWALDDVEVSSDDDPAFSGVRADRVALATEVDPITFGPAVAPSKSFPSSTSKIYLSFRLKGVRPGAKLNVSWFRQDEDQPLSEAEEILEGDLRMAAEHEAEQPFRPGPHFVRVEIDGERLLEVPFIIEEDPGAAAAGPTRTTGSSNPASVSNLGLYAQLDRQDRPRGRPLTRFPAGTKSVYAAFLVNRAPPGTAVSVRWLLGDTLAATTDLGRVAGRRVLSASLEAPGSLAAGEYEAEILIEGARRATKRFTVLGRGRGNAGVAGLVLTTAIESRTNRPAAPSQTAFRGDEQAIYLCLDYRGMRAGEAVEVRWFQDQIPDEPITVSTIRVGAPQGNLAASFFPEGALPPGAYHAQVRVRNEEVASVPFTVGH